MTLEPTVTSTEGGAKVAHAFTRSSDSLLASGPELLSEVVGVDSTTNSHSVPVLGNSQGVELDQVDSNAVVHLPQRGESAMMAVVGKNGDALLVGVFYLW